MKKLSANLPWLFLLLVVVFMPIQPLFSEFLSYHTTLSGPVLFWIAHWYEPVLVIFAFYLLFFNSKKIGEADILTGLALVLLGAISVIFFSPSLGRGVEGFRFTLLGVVFYLAARSNNLNKKKIDTLLNSYLILSLLIAVWAIIERFLPLKYLELSHIISPDSAFGYGWHTVVGVPQSASLLGGPNQLASYLLPAVFILLVRSAKFLGLKQDKTALKYLAGVLIVNTAMLLTISRSALVGYFATLMIVPVLIARNKFFKIIAIVMAILVIAGTAVSYFSESQSIKDIVTHGGSQIGHIQALETSSNEIWSRLHEPVKLALGAGLSTAGPLVIKYGDGIISESWYLQLILEIGILGLLLWLFFVFVIVKKLLKKKEYGLSLGLISVSIAALFLHTFADNPALTYTLFILIGLKLSSSELSDNS